MKKLPFIFISCLASCLLTGCGKDDPNAVELEMEDVVLDIPANNGDGPAIELDPDTPPPPPPPPPPPGTETEKKEEVTSLSVPPEKVEASVNRNLSKEGDAGLVYTIQVAVESYYAQNRKLPESIKGLVKAGHLETFPIVPPGKKVRIDGKTLIVTIETESGDDD